MLYLFGPKETDFINGDSDLIHHTYDEVVDRSKGFYLKFKIALDNDESYKEIKKEMIISAYTPDGWNQFRVFDIYNHTNHVEVVATQLHYDLNYKKVFPFVVSKTTAQTALNVFVENFKSDLPNFKFTSNITDVHSFSTDDDLERLEEGHNALEILNRIASRWGGELKVDGYNVHLTHKLGEFTNALLYEHKNISEFVDETSMSEIITRIHAVSRFRPEREEGSSEEPEEVTIKVVVDSPLIDEYAQVYEEDFTNNDARTRDQLIAWARLKYTTNNVDKPARSINVETNIIDGQEINYGDDLVLKYTKHDVDEIIRCVGYQYNPNSRQYISVTLGSNLNSLASTITGSVHDSTKNQLSNIEKQVQIIKYASNNSNRVTTGPLPIPDPIEGDMWYYHPDGRPNDVELRIFQDGGWVTIISDMTGENVRRAIADLELEADALAEDIIASDQKAEAAKEEAGLAKNAVDALEIITQETAGKMADVEQIAADAEGAAADALAEASAAKTDAGQAAIDASEAKTDATDALAKARESATNSSGALALAGQAATDAATAISDAQTAMDNANTALSTAGSADTKAGQAIAKADAIPDTITGIIADKNLVNGTYVDSKVDTATGAWSQELVRVEGKLDGLEIGGRNYWIIAESSEHKVRAWASGVLGTEENSLSSGFIPTEPDEQFTINYPVSQSLYYNKDKEYIGGFVTSMTTPGSGTGYGHLNSSGRPDDDVPAYVVYTLRNNFIANNPDYRIMLEKGNTSTDWSPAPEDLYSQEDFKLFSAQYTQDVEGVTGRLTKVENNKLDGTTFQTFKQSEYQVTADKVASTITRVDTAEGKITTQGTSISQNATAIASKADKTVVDTLSGTVTNQGTAISQNATDISSKAEQEEVNQIKGTVDTHTTEISQNATAITSKASQTEVDTISGTVSTHTTKISQNATAISARLTQTQVDNLVNDKGYSTVSYVDSEMTATAGAIRTEMSVVEGKIPTQIGGRNLIRNSDFSQGNKHWSFLHPIKTENGLNYISQAYGWGTSYKYFVEKGEYTLSVLVRKGPNYTAGRLRITQDIKDESGNNVIPTRNLYVSIYHLNDIWGRVSTTFTVPEGTHSISGFYLNESHDGGQIDMTEFKLERGNVRTDWTPAPEDMLSQNDFSTFKAEYEQSAEGWSTKLTQIEQADYASKSWSNQTFATPQSVNTQLTSYAKTTDLNGLVTETALANKSYITSSAVNTLLSSYAKTTALNGLATETYVGTQISTTAGAIRTEMTAVEGKIPTEIGGRNLLRNSRIVTHLSNGNWFPISSEIITEGDRSFLRIRRTNVSSEPTTMSIYNTIHISDISNSIFDNEQTVVSFKARASKTVGLSLLKTTVGGSTTVVGEGSNSRTITNEWQTIKVVFPKIPNDIAALRVGPYAINTDISNFYLDVCEWKIESGNIVTDWTPAPEDLMEQNDFNSFKAEYDQSAEGWSTKLTQIEQADYASKSWSNQTFATPQSVSTQLTSYAKTTDLNGLATETYVGNKISASAETIGLELTKIEGKIPTKIGTRNYFVRKEASFDRAIIWASGNPGPETNSLSTGFIPAVLGDAFRTSEKTPSGQMVFYNSEKQLLGSSFQTSGSIIVDGVHANVPSPLPADKTIAFMRLSFRNNFLVGKNRSELKIMINKGTVLADWELSPEDRETETQSYVNSQLSITSSSINSTITGILGDISKGKNLIPYVERGAISAASGLDWDVEQAQDRVRTPMIDVRGISGYQNLTLSKNGEPINGNWTLFRYLPDETLIDNINRAGTTPINITDSVGFVRAVWYETSDDANFQLEVGTSITNFVPYSSDVTQYQIAKAAQDLNGFKQTVQSTYGTKTEMSLISQKANSIEALVGADGENIAQIALTSDLFATKVRELPSGANLHPPVSDTSASSVSRAELTVLSDNAIRVAYESTAGTTPYAFLPAVSLTNGSKYTLSFKVRLTAGGNRTLSFGLRNGGFADRGLVLSPNKDTYVQHTFTATATTNVARLILFFNGFREGATIDIRDIVLNSGSEAVPWTPSLKPVESQVTQLSDSITQSITTGSDGKITSLNQLTNTVNSMEQVIGTTNESVARAVMTSTLWETEVSKVIDGELEQQYKYVDSPQPYHTATTSRSVSQGTNEIITYLPLGSDGVINGSRLEVDIEYETAEGSKGNPVMSIQLGDAKSVDVTVYHSMKRAKFHLFVPQATVHGDVLKLNTSIADAGVNRWGYINRITVSIVERIEVPIDGANTGAISSKITQLYDMINLSVLGKEGALSRISMGEEGIQIDGKLLHITARTFIDDAVIKSAMISTLDAGKITTGELNANNVKVINLDANSISGNEASFIQAMFTARHSALQISGNGITVSKSNGDRTFEVDSNGARFYSDTGPGAYITTHNVLRWNGSSWVDSGANSVLFASELNHSIGIGYKIYANGQYVTRDAIRLDRSGSGTPELQVNLPIKNIEWQNGTVSGEYGTYFRNTQKTAGIWMGNNGKLCLITYGKLYNSTAWLNP